MSGRGLAILFGSLAFVALAQTYAMLFCFAFLTGWRRLARAYPLEGNRSLLPLSPTRGVAFAAWGWNAPPLRLGYDDDVLVLRPLPFFRPAFHTLVIPWNAVERVERKETFEGEVLMLRFGASGRDRMAFLPSVMDEALAGRAEGGNIRGSSLSPGENCS